MWLTRTVQATNTRILLYVSLLIFISAFVFLSTGLTSWTLENFRNIRGILARTFIIFPQAYFLLILSVAAHFVEDKGTAGLVLRTLWFLAFFLGAAWSAFLYIIMNT